MICPHPTPVSGTIPLPGILDWINKGAEQQYASFTLCLLIVAVRCSVIQTPAAETSLPWWTAPWVVSYKKSFLPLVAFVIATGQAT